MVHIIISTFSINKTPKPHEWVGNHKTERSPAYSTKVISLSNYISTRDCPRGNGQARFSGDKFVFFRH